MKSTRIQELRDLAANKGLTRADAQQFITELCDAMQERKARQEKPKFALSDVMKEAEKMGWAKGKAEECFDSCQEVGWVRGKNKIPYTDLTATMRNWMRRDQKWNGAVNGKNGSEPPKGWDVFLKETRYDYQGKFNHAPEYLRLEFATWKKEAGRKKDATLNLS